MIARARRLRNRLSHRWERWYATFWTSHLARVVFVHINKTGGSSVEQALGLPFQHRTAMEFRRLMGDRRFERAFRFTVVRNPFDKVASHYRYRVKTNQTGLGDRHIGFSEWVCRAYGDRERRYHDQPLMFAPQVEWLREPGGDLLVEFVAKFERLHEDFAEIARRMGRATELPHLKSSLRGEPIPTAYSDAARDVLLERFAEDFAEFGYARAPTGAQRSERT